MQSTAETQLTASQIAGSRTLKARAHFSSKSRLSLTRVFRLDSDPDSTEAGYPCSSTMQQVPHRLGYDGFCDYPSSQYCPNEVCGPVHLSDKPGIYPRWFRFGRIQALSLRPAGWRIGLLRNSVCSVVYYTTSFLSSTLFYHTLRYFTILCALFLFPRIAIAKSRLERIGLRVLVYASR